MKLVRISWIAALVAAGTLTLTPAQAADQSNTRPNQGQGQEQRRQQMRQQRMERLSQELSLTEVQKKKVAALWDKQAAKLRELRAENQADPAQRREHMQTLRKEMNAEMKKLLTTEQFAKYETIENERLNRMRQGGQRGPGQGGGGGQGRGGNR
jgi:Spy/CpxP family protein refolding chaperone